jgi:N-acetylglucosamine-6-phosphate deacetylase
MSSLIVRNGRILAGQTILTEAFIEMARGASPPSVPPMGTADEEIDLDGGWLLPGFIDTQVNGGGGVLFNDEPTAQGIAAIGAAHARYGTTAFLPTLISDEPEVIAAALDAADAAIEAGVPGVVGVHIEGPFINPKRKGIHSEARLRRLDDDMVNC